MNHPEQESKRQIKQNQHLQEENTEKDIKSHLKETTPENWNAASSIEVHQLEDISSSLGKMVILNGIDWNQKL